MVRRQICRSQLAHRCLPVSGRHQYPAPVASHRRNGSSQATTTSASNSTSTLWGSTLSRPGDLLATSQGKSAEIYHDGQPLTFEQSPQQVKKGEFEAHLPFDQVRRGTHVVAARVAGPVAFGATILDLRMDLVTGEQEDVEVKLVTEKAVVCDQCSSLAGDRHACVYACPHEAALRIDAWVEFPQL